MKHRKISFYRTKTLVHCAYGGAQREECMTYANGSKSSIRGVSRRQFIATSIAGGAALVDFLVGFVVL